MLWAVGGCVAAAISAGIGLSVAAGSRATGDYGSAACANWQCDDPSRSLHAIATGNLGDFFHFQPAMGLTSLALRAPAVAIAHSHGGGLAREYQAGTAVCFAVASLLVVWIAWMAWRRGARLPAVFGALALWMLAILWSRSEVFGHPEEPLAAALVIASLASAASGRAALAGLLLGLAIGTKEWALLAAPAIAFAAGTPGWRRAAACGLAMTVVTVGVMFAGSPSTFRKAHEGQRAGDKHTITPASIWFRLGERREVGRQGDLVFSTVSPPKIIGRWCRPFIIAFALTASLLFAWRWRRRGWDATGALALAAFVLLERVLFDTQTFSYHLIPMLMAVALWEVFAKRRLPIVATAATVAFQITARKVATDHGISADAFNAIYLAWTVPLLLLLGVACFGMPSRLRPRARSA